MNISIKEAYKTAKRILEYYKIYSCVELDNCWLFAWCMKNDDPVMLPPIQVLKDGSFAGLMNDPELKKSLTLNTYSGYKKYISVEELEQMK